LGLTRFHTVHIRQKGRTMNDETLVPGGDLQIQVSEALANDPRTAEAVIEVIVEQGLVTLQGTVKNEEIRRAAREIADAQPGVIEVIDDLAVVPPRPDDGVPGAAPLAPVEGQVPPMPKTRE
jgi:osmotically-inducible protein OsmY